MVMNSLTPTFSWNSAGGATGYGLYIRDMTAFGAPLIYPNSSGTTYSPLTGTSFTIPAGCLVNGHTYRWNMTSFVGTTEGNTASTVLYFQTPAAVTLAAATQSSTAVVNPPTINSPGSASSPGIVAGSLTPTFGWNWVSGATGYGLYIRDMTAPGTPLVYPNASGTTATPIVGFDFGSGPTFSLPSGYLVNGHTYRWNMTSFIGSTESGGVSGALYFQTPAAVARISTINSPSSSSSTGAVPPPTTISPGYASSPGILTGSLAPVFSWNAVSGATGYGLYIRDMTAFGAPLVYPNSSGTTYYPLVGTSLALPAGKLVNGHIYRWNMTSFTGLTESTTASSVLYFQTPAAVISTLTASSSSIGTSRSSSSTENQTTSSSVKSIFGQSLAIRNTSSQTMIAVVTGGGSQRTYNITAGSTVAITSRLKVPSQSVIPTPTFTSYSGATFGGGDAAVGGNVSFTIDNNGNRQITYTVGGAGVLRGSVYVTPGQFGACWAPGVNLGVTPVATSAEGYICIGTDGLTLGADASAGLIVSGFSIQFSPLQPSNTIQSSNTMTMQSVTYAALTLNTFPSNGGTVSGGGDFASGSSQTVTAIPNYGFNFECWMENGRVVSLSAIYNFNFSGNRNLVAHFRPDSVDHAFSPNSPPNYHNQNLGTIKNFPSNFLRRTNQIPH
jgi:hypothetical protein